MISVIIPVFNAAAKGLEQCLDRVTNQSFAEIQVILVDDGSTDNSLAICKQWVDKDDRFSLVSQTNQGPAAARNTALELAKGEEIAFIDCDDLPDVHLLQNLHESMVDHNADMAMARFNDVADTQMKLMDGCLTGRDLQLGLFDYYTPLYKNLFAKLYRRELLDNIRFADLRTAEDVDFQSRLYPSVKRCAYVDQSLYIYNMYKDSVMHTQMARDYLDILQCYEGMVERTIAQDSLLYGRSLDALMRKIVSLRYRNRSLNDNDLRDRLELLKKKYLPAYRKCDNGCWLVKMGLLICLKQPWLHALVMDYRER